MKNTLLIAALALTLFSENVFAEESEYEGMTQKRGWGIEVGKGMWGGINYGIQTPGLMGSNTQVYFRVQGSESDEVDESGDPQVLSLGVQFGGGDFKLKVGVTGTKFDGRMGVTSSGEVVELGYEDSIGAEFGVGYRISKSFSMNMLYVTTGEDDPVDSGDFLSEDYSQSLVFTIGLGW